MLRADATVWARASDEVERALRRGVGVVALESTVIAHGLPRPRNLEVARAMEDSVRRAGAEAATIAVIGGAPRAGLQDHELEAIATSEGIEKLSTRDLPVAVARRLMGATTVAATAAIAAATGIEVFATGGIGGVHRGLPPDISADLGELARTPIVVVSAGAKSILDLPATRELLEALGVLVLGWRTDRFPAFYTRDAGVSVDARVDGADEVAEIWKAHRQIGAEGAILLCAPIPEEAALDPAEVDGAIERALASAATAGVTGKQITPYLLQAVADATRGASLDANVALLMNNGAVAAEVAVAITRAR